MNNLTKISVIMAVYKESKEELKMSIESILNQTYRNFEYIIILDNPDEEWRIDFIKSYKYKRIKLFVNKKNMGLVYSLNRGLKNATGDYIARMDADDISMDVRFEKQIAFLEENHLDLCGSQFVTFIDKDDIDTIYNPIKSDDINSMLKYGTCIAHPSWFGKKNIFEKLEGYRDIPACEDYDFLIRAAMNGFMLGNCNEILLRYRLSPKSISRSNPGKQEVIANYVRNKYKKHTHFSMNEFNEYIHSKKYEKDLKKYNNYLKKVSNVKLSKNLITKFVHCILLLPNINYVFRRIKVNCIRKKYITK